MRGSDDDYTFSRALSNFTANSTTSGTVIDAGDSAWMLASSALVIVMTIPGVALFYGGLVPGARNFVATAMQTLSITCLISALWLIVGYSLAFAPVDLLVSGPPFFGDFSRAWLLGMNQESVHQLASTIPESVYCMFQLTFAIITPALICGSFVERMKFSSLLIFIGLWHVFVYCPVAHANWHPNGFLFKLGVLDFAGGNVVHIASGMSAFVASMVVGKGFGSLQMNPHNLVLTLMGTGFLWIGWFGFNAGSAGSASTRAGMAMLATQIATGVAGLSGMLTSWFVRGKPSLLQMCSGAVSGLVAITPAAGYVNPFGAFIIGVLSGPVCYLGTLIKYGVGVDDSLDAFGIHAIGGALGGLLTGCFADVNICGVEGAFYGNPRQLITQLQGILFTFGWTSVMTFLILVAIDYTIGLRVRIRYNNVGVSSHGGNKRTNPPFLSSHHGQSSKKNLFTLSSTAPKDHDFQPPEIEGDCNICEVTAEEEYKSKDVGSLFTRKIETTSSIAERDSAHARERSDMYVFRKEDYDPVQE